MGVMNGCIAAVHAHLVEAVAGFDPVPVTCIGELTVEQPFQAVTLPVPSSVTVSDRATSSMGASGARGCYRIEFSVPVELKACRHDGPESAATVLEWYEAFAKRIALDKTLGGLCVHAQPYLSAAATGNDQRGRAVGAVDCGVAVKAEIDPTK